MAEDTAFTSIKRSLWGKKIFCLITGASQGIGRQLTINFAEKVAAGSTFLLIARNVDGLNETKCKALEVNKNVNIITDSLDLSKPVSGRVHSAINSTLEFFKTKPTDFEGAVIVHNAGSLGDLSELVRDMTDLKKWEEYFTLNLFSVSILTADFLKIFDPCEGNTESEFPQITMINITSLCAVKPFTSMGYYCIGKASREMYFQVLATENPKYSILNYSPGPVLTNMTSDIINNINNPEMRKMFVDMKDSDTILKPHESVGKLIDILEKGNFESGNRIDFYDP